MQLIADGDGVMIHFLYFISVCSLLWAIAYFSYLPVGRIVDFLINAANRRRRGCYDWLLVFYFGLLTFVRDSRAGWLFAHVFSSCSKISFPCVSVWLVVKILLSKRPELYFVWWHINWTSIMKRTHRSFRMRVLGGNHGTTGNPSLVWHRYGDKRVTGPNNKRITTMPSKSHE